MTLSITRIVNACALITLDGETVLTDPYFEKQWFVPLREPIGMKAQDLPKLSAILGGHSVWDHWQPRSLKAYPSKADTPVLVATPAMARKAKAVGFDKAEVVAWHDTRWISSRLAVDVVPAQMVTGLKANNYVLRAGDLKVFVGTEARDPAPLYDYRSKHGPVDVALLPIDGSTFAGQQLVMTAAEAIEGARALGAKALVPIHFALKPVPILLHTPTSLGDLLELKTNVRDLEIVVLAAGERWGC